MSATRATRVVICGLLLPTQEKSGARSVLTAGQPSPRKGRTGGRTLRLGVVPSARLEVDAEPLKPAQGSRERHEVMAGTRPRLGLICRPCEESPTSMAMFSKEPTRRLSSRISPRSSRETREVLQEMENPQQARTGNLQPGREPPPDWGRLGHSVPRRRDLDRGRRRGGTSRAVTSPMAAGSNTEVRGGGTTSPTAVGGAMAAESLTSLGRVGGTARGDTVASPTTAAATRAEAHGEIATSLTTAVAMEAAVRAGATASPITGGSGVLTGRAHPGALRVPGRPLGLIAVGKTTRARTAMSGRAAA